MYWKPTTEYRFQIALFIQLSQNEVLIKVSNSYQETNPALCSLLRAILKISIRAWLRGRDAAVAVSSVQESKGEMGSLLNGDRCEKAKSSAEPNSPILFCCRHPGKPQTWTGLPCGALQLPGGLQEKISSQCFPAVPPPPHRTSAQHLARNLEGFLISFYVHTYYPHKKVRLNYTLRTVGGLNTAVQQTICSLSTLWEWCCLKYPVIFCHQVIWEWNYINKQQRRANRLRFPSPEVTPFTWSISIALNYCPRPGLSAVAISWVFHVRRNLEEKKNSDVTGKEAAGI